MPSCDDRVYYSFFSILKNSPQNNRNSYNCINNKNNMDNKEKVFSELQKLYALQPDSVKWVPEGGELLEYIGQRVVFVDFLKDEESGKWKNTIKEATIISISDYDKTSMTYQIKYKISREDTERSERIIPEGFNVDFTKPEKKTMHRFIPYSVHFRLMETELIYGRLKELFNSRDTLPISSLVLLSGQTKELLYSRNICAVIECDDKEKTLMYFRITGLKLYRHVNQPSQLIISDDTKKITFSLSFVDTDKYYIPTYKSVTLGKMKLIDLQG